MELNLAFSFLNFWDAFWGISDKVILFQLRYELLIHFRLGRLELLDLPPLFSYFLLPPLSSLIRTILAFLPLTSSLFRSLILSSLRESLGEVVQMVAYKSQDIV